MAGFLSIPLKKSYDLDIAGPVRTFIACTYSTSEMPTDYESINDFNKLRSKACVQPLDKHESSLEILYRYYDQLVAIEGKLPLTPTQIPIPFKWKDCFDRGGLFGSKSSLSLSYGSYEKACVMFNIAALQSQIAVSQKLDTDDELKLAARLFMQAAGVLNALKDGVLSMVPQDPTSDLMPDTLSALSALMLAQAREAIYLKATKDEMKPALIAKIAAQVADFYFDAGKQMGRDGLRTIWDRDWLPCVNGKHQAFLALAQYHQSLIAKENKEIGEELSRLTSASQSMHNAQTQFANGHSPGLFKAEAAAIQKAFELAKKDNDFIYHERIPDAKTLPVIQKAQPAKAQPMNHPLSRGFKDLFEKLTPISVQQALARYDARKGTIVQGEVARLREHTNLMNTILASLNLPAALEDATSREALPESIREKSTKIKGMGGISALERMINDLPNLLKRNQEILEETRRMLNDEKASDDELRNQFKERWTRMPSEKLTDVLYQELARYTNFLATATNADKIVKEKFDTNRHGFELLSKTELELKSAIPTLGSGSGGTGSPAVQKLKQLMEEVNEIKNEREKLENELKNKTFDMTSTFLKALAESNAINDDQISMDKLNEIYGPLRTSVSESIQRQERVMAEVQTANDQFAHEKGAGSGQERENVLKMLVTSHDAFLELYANLEEGSKFYNDLTPIILRFQSKVSDYCFARKTEKEDLMKDLQRNIVSQPSAAVPNQPSYHGGQSTPTTTASNQPPARPPPPRFQNPPVGQQQPVQSIQPTFGAQPYVPYGAPPQQATTPTYGQPQPSSNPYPYSLSYSSYPNQPPMGQQYSATMPYPSANMPGYPPYPNQPYGMPQPQGYPPQPPQQWHQ